MYFSILVCIFVGILTSTGFYTVTFPDGSPCLVCGLVPSFETVRPTSKVSKV